MSVKHGLDALIFLKSSLFWSQFDDFKNYLDLMESFVNAELLRMQREYDKFYDDYKDNSDKIPEIEFERYISDYIDRFHVTSDKFSYILRKSAFISIYAFFEAELLRIVKNIERIESFNIEDSHKLSNKLNKGMQDYHLFIEKHLHISIDYNRKEYFAFNVLRNHFVHNELNEIKEPIKLEPLLNQHIKLNTNYDIKNKEFVILNIDKTLNYRFLEFVESYFEKLIYKIESSNRSNVNLNAIYL